MRTRFTQCGRFHFGPMTTPPIVSRCPPAEPSLLSWHCHACGRDLTNDEQALYARMHKTFAHLKIRIWGALMRGGGIV